ncbi:MAG TPA: 2TM domain-containing protein [Flavisolibacter sp.]|jgi:hypothetical protein|nr:2TM domain-containing protein [Flavisolibacter sp.]
MADFYQPALKDKDPLLWQLAQRRAAFKRHLTSYVIINLFLWILWYFTGGKTYGSGVPWPVWPTLGWGIGIAFSYAGAYLSNGSTVEREYDKLNNNQSKQ